MAKAAPARSDFLQLDTLGRDLPDAFCSTPAFLKVNSYLPVALSEAPPASPPPRAPGLQGRLNFVREV